MHLASNLLLSDIVTLTPQKTHGIVRRGRGNAMHSTERAGRSAVPPRILARIFDPRRTACMAFNGRPRFRRR